MSEARGRPESEFAAYVRAAEERLARCTEPVAESLRWAYEQVRRRFEVDLGQGRDLTVSRAAALMLVEAVLRAAPAHGVSREAVDPAPSLIDELALVVASETLHDGVRVWKTIDYSITARWHHFGWIEDPRGTAKSLVLTPEGLRRVQTARDKLAKGSAA